MRQRAQVLMSRRRTPVCVARRGQSRSICANRPDGMRSLIAAAAPLLPPGLQLSYVNVGGQSVDVVLDNDRVLRSEEHTSEL